MWQTLADCTFCDALSGTGSGKAHTWGQDEQVTNPICVDCVIKAEPGPGERDHCTCDGCCRLVVDMIAASPAFHAGFQRGLRSRPAHTVPRRTRPSREIVTAVCEV